MELLERLRSIFDASRVSVDRKVLEAYSKDETHGLEAYMADYVVWPVNTKEVQQLVMLCLETQTPMVPRGAGTGKSGGAVPVKGGVVISFEQMNKIKGIYPEELIAIVEPGLILEDFKKRLAEKNLFYPPDPVSSPWCTLGGNVAENASGPNTLKYGTTKDYVLGLEAVLPTGEIIQCGKRTRKGVTGLDVTSLLCGSEGTLAIVTQITLKLLPRPAFYVTAFVSFPSTKNGALAVSTILSNGFLPRCLEYMDDAVLEKPSLWIELDGDNQEALLEALQQINTLLIPYEVGQFIVAQNEKQRRDIWKIRQEASFQVKKLKPFRVSEDVVVPISRLADLVEEVERLGCLHALLTCSFGHAGDGNLHVQVLFDSKEDRPKVEALLKDLFTYTLSLGGTLTGEHGIGIAKDSFLFLELSPEIIHLQRRIKAAFDPNGILNPGKKGC